MADDEDDAAHMADVSDAGASGAGASGAGASVVGAPMTPPLN